VDSMMAQFIPKQNELNLLTELLKAKCPLCSK
jgi:hypothetical protein